jgi:hypothetical protein
LFGCVELSGPTDRYAYKTIILQVVEITQGGVIEPEDLLWVGGSYSWLDRIRRGGIGSPKVIYVSGIPAFDQLSHQVEGQTTFANFELLREGLLLRGNCTQRIAAVALRYEEIESIHLMGYPVKIRVNTWRLRSETQTIYKGALSLRTTDGQRAVFALRVSEYESVLAFFSNAPEFQASFQSERSTAPLQEDSKIARQLALLGD